MNNSNIQRDKIIPNIIPLIALLFSIAWWEFVDALRDHSLDKFITVILFMSMGFITRAFMIKNIRDKKDVLAQNQITSEIIDSLPAAVYVFDEHDKCIHVNKQAASDIGKTPAGLIGKHAHGITNLRAIATEGKRFITNEFSIVGHEGLRAGKVLMFMPESIIDDDTHALAHKDIPRLKSRNHDMWEKEKGIIIDQLKELAEKLGRSPTAKDLNGGSSNQLSNINFHFDSLNAALVAAGLEPIPEPNIPWHKRIFKS